MDEGPRKRPRVGDVSSTPVSGSDIDELTREGVCEWNRLIQGGRRWTDESFPPSQRSIDGKATSTPTPSPPPAAAGVCLCGKALSRSKVKMNTPNRGREYLHCATRSCKYFCWVGGVPKTNDRRPLEWTRLVGVPVVSDYGFEARHLRQGGVGDCWFLSALAVVAERHDLVARLFADTAANTAGAYCLRLFLDGLWTTVLVDDNLPITPSPRRSDLTFGSNLAFSRCGTESGQLLWACLLEKAYAKAHGSYQAISGGEIAEALLDLTGAPTWSIHFDASDFNSEELWIRLQEYKRAKLPMGCATDHDPLLREVGLCGGHAYSILDVTEAMNFDGTAVRLLRIRNPHGVGEWRGDFSDNSAKWSQLIEATNPRLRRTGVDDGTFWIDYTHFLMGFALVDVCFAYPGWHERSFGNAFPSKGSLWRVCRNFHRVRAKEACTLFLIPLQPTKRGAWCRDDRKKSYRPGDVSLLVMKLACHGGVRIEGVVGGMIQGVQIMGSNSLSCKLEGGCEYVVLPLCLGSEPAAAVDSSKPFHVRFYCSHPLDVSTHEFRENDGSLAKLALDSLHHVCLKLPLNQGFMVDLLPRPPLRRSVICCGDDCLMVKVSGSGSLAMFAVNMGDEKRVFEAHAITKSHVGRGIEGLLPNDVELADRYTKANPTEQKRGGGYRFPAKWRAYKTSCSVAPSSIQLVLLVVRSGVQGEIGEVVCEVSAGRPSKSQQSSLRQWLYDDAILSTDAEQRASRREVNLQHGLFSPVPITHSDLHTLLSSQVVDHHGLLSLPSSMSTAAEDDERSLQSAIALSLAHASDHGNEKPHHHHDHDQEDSDLMAAIALSLQGSPHPPHPQIQPGAAEPPKPPREVISLLESDDEKEALSPPPPPIDQQVNGDSQPPSNKERLRQLHLQRFDRLR